jgi:hypothetical protein
LYPSYVLLGTGRFCSYYLYGQPYRFYGPLSFGWTGQTAHHGMTIDLTKLEQPGFGSHYYQKGIV